jgi:hypothetical protein
MRYTRFQEKSIGQESRLRTLRTSRSSPYSGESSTVLLHSTTSRRFHRSRPLQHCVSETQETGDDAPLSDILWPMTRVSDGMLRPVLLRTSTSGARSAFNFACLVTMTNVNPLTEVSWIHEMVPWSFVERSLHRDFSGGATEPPGNVKAVMRYAVRVIPYESFPSWRRSLPKWVIKTQKIREAR